MALYGLNVQTISRLKGGSVAKTASYILRENVFDLRLNKMHYYAHTGDLLYSDVLIPDNAPQEFHNLETLLGAIDMAEKRYDARTGRVVRLTLPNDREISDEERIELARDFVKDVFISEGMCAVLAIHEGRNEDPEKSNPHAHVILTDRPVDKNGFCSKKNREWNKVKFLYKCRKLWAEAQNEFFVEKGMEVRVSHQSLEVQGIDREPMIPLGRAAMALERKGIRTENGDKNREIEIRNREREEEKHLRRRERNHKRNRGRSR